MRRTWRASCRCSRARRSAVWDGGTPFHLTQPNNLFPSFSLSFYLPYIALGSEKKCYTLLKYPEENLSHPLTPNTKQVCLGAAPPPQYRQLYFRRRGDSRVFMFAGLQLFRTYTSHFSCGWRRI